MRITIYLKSGTIIEDCMITSITKINDGQDIKVTDFYGSFHIYKYKDIALITMRD